ncbi:MAG: porin [Opitutaceae bacterium]
MAPRVWIQLCLRPTLVAFGSGLIPVGWSEEGGSSELKFDRQLEDVAPVAEPADPHAAGPVVIKSTVTPELPTSPAPPPVPEISSYWRFRWMGWDGIAFEIQENTSIPNPPAMEEKEILSKFSRFSVDRVKFTAKIGMRIDLDLATFLNGGDAADLGTRMELRRFRILTKGDFLLLFPFLYQLELGYVPHAFYVENMYLAMDQIPILGQVKTGGFSAPMGFENMVSSQWQTFMELDSASAALTPGIEPGVQFNRTFSNNRMTLTGGLFADGLTNDASSASSDYGRLIGRVTWLARVDEGDDPDRSAGLTHFGASVNWIKSGSSQIRYRARPEAHAAPYAIDTGDIPSDSAATVGLEFVHLQNGLLLQTEVFHSKVDLDDAPSLGFFGGYVSGSWIISGERRTYDRKRGVFSSVAPSREFSWNDWKDTSWAFSIRGSYTDLSDHSIDGGRMLLGTVGLTAYLQDRIRVKLNVVAGNSWTETTTARHLAIETRLSIDLGP